MPWIDLEKTAYAFNIAKSVMERKEKFMMARLILAYRVP